MTAEETCPICPICKKPVDIDKGVYRLDDAIFHPKCYEEWRKKSAADSERDPQ